MEYKLKTFCQIAEKLGAKKIVIAPKIWFNSKEANAQHTLPINWIRI